jgi:hypothetical protein
MRRGVCGAALTLTLSRAAGEGTQCRHRVPSPAPAGEGTQCRHRGPSPAPAEEGQGEGAA